MGERKGWKGGLAEQGLLSAGVVLVVALLGLLNYFGWKYHKRLDWTSAELYTLSEKSLAVVRGLDRDVETIVFMRPGGELYDEVTELLARYEAASPRIRLRLLDPERNLAEAQSLVDRYQVTGLDVVVFDAGDGNTRIVQAADLAEYDYSGMQFGQAPTLKGFKGEQQLTSALLNLSESEKPKILFTKGHGEHALDDFSSGGLSAAADYLERENFEVEEWASLGRAALPADTDLVVVAGPTSTFVPPEVEMFDRYLAGGGRMLVLLDPVPSRTGSGELLATGLEQWLAGWGVDVGNDVVVDPANPLPFFGSETLFVTDYGTHPITRSVQDGGLPVLISLARSAGAGTVPDGYRSTVLMRTSAQGWGETDISTAELER
ncbi:MAG: Gldg family protein, partial [Thermoanaerobaculia bacterium]